MGEWLPGFEESLGLEGSGSGDGLKRAARGILWLMGEFYTLTVSALIPPTGLQYYTYFCKMVSLGATCKGYVGSL